ncbi:MAG TPA: GspE/PulE family protein [Verrucomicrobiota bacterium]|jgi:general secretion pathway protein E/type IV pilus assembly protein PilB|nr:type II/IV secretion system protein [Verrucomicrobiota bacterium]HRR65398.1 GspE/PulE family protein [Candidatus Paceibacterota bacterium]MDI9371389.1 GspE/PulE family protein [Verrucomicrobiota bacterium]NLH86545.1 type II/IV secretion system protein [Verrucomicrobiota bacterium]HNR70771.1 GspE/PulE family protein [Verrucomicrobiota bacterium]
MSQNPDSGPKEAGDLLLEQGKLTEAQLEQVRRRQRRLNLPQHRAIVDLNFASEEDTWRALAAVRHLEFVDPFALGLKRDILELVPIKLIFHYHLLPVRLEEDCLTLAFSEPPTQIEQGNLRLLLSKRFKIALATPSSIHAVIKKNFGLGAETIQKLREDRGGAEISQEITFDLQGKETDSAIEATVSAFVDQILQEALRLKATDIHLEPYANSVRLRYRVDGILETVPVPADMRQLQPAVVSRLKIMAGLNIAEKRLPHDGRIAMKTGQEEYDLRVSIMPAKYGEAVCLRILGRQNLFLDLSHLGMEPSQEAVLAQLTQLPQGMVLLTGPTGSGKTTTLYAALAQANDEGRKIITFEDPIEYQLEGTVQIQVREQIGLTFAAGLRSVLRHDPDVVLVGEIRDFETAEIAVRAAQTGHLVFSTLHTNDSVSAVTRLLEMRIEPYLIASSLVCSIAQRLARRICRHCSEEDHSIADATRKEMATALSLPASEVKAWKGRGCVECNHKGHRGRVAIYEFFLLNEAIMDLIQPGLRTGELRKAARELGWRSLREMAWRKVQEGLIPISEQERWTRVIDPAALLPKA